MWSTFLPLPLSSASVGVLLICLALVPVCGETAVKHSEGPLPRGPRDFFVIYSVYRCHCLLERKVNLIIHNSVKANCSEVIILEICPQRITFSLRIRSVLTPNE